MNEPRRWSWWTRDIATNLVCRWHSQGGTEYTYPKPYMQVDIDHLLATMGDELEEIHSKAFHAISADHTARREQERNTIIYDLVSKGRYDIIGRGVVYTVDNPKDTKADDWNWLINHKVRIDGRVCFVTGVERFAIGGTYPKGKPIGLLVREEGES